MHGAGLMAGRAERLPVGAHVAARALVPCECVALPTARMRISLHVMQQKGPLGACQLRRKVCLLAARSTAVQSGFLAKPCRACNDVRMSAYLLAAAALHCSSQEGKCLPSRLHARCSQQRVHSPYS